MKNLAIMCVTIILAACSSLGIHDPGPEQRAARNLCEVMRSFRPYYPNECGEQSGGVPPTYGTQ
jgi:hypothetical protein